MIETEAARARIERQDEMTLTAAWLTASLQRAKKIPPLKTLLGRSDAKSDIGFYLAGAKAALPKIKMSDWMAAKAKVLPPE